MKSRLTHLAMLVLGGLGVVLTFLGSVPKYAGLAGAGLLLVTDLRKALSAPDAVKPAASLFALLFLGHALFGCATTAKVVTVAKSCEPTIDQGTAILGAAAKPSRAEALAAIDALGFVLCVLQKGADEAIAKLEAKAQARAEMALMAGVGPEADPRLGNLKAWRAVHP